MPPNIYIFRVRVVLYSNTHLTHPPLREREYLVIQNSRQASVDAEIAAKEKFLSELSELVTVSSEIASVVDNRAE